MRSNFNARNTDRFFRNKQRRPDFHYEGQDTIGHMTFVVYKGSSGKFWWSLTEWDGELFGEPEGPFTTAHGAWQHARKYFT